MTAADSGATPVRGLVSAWLGGAVAALGAASLTVFMHGMPLGRHLWQHVAVSPLENVSLPVAFVTALCTGLAAAWVGATVYPVRRVVGLLTAASLLVVSQSMVLALYGIAWEPLPALLALAAAGTVAALRRPVVPSSANWFHGRVAPRILTKLKEASDPGLLCPDQRDATVVTCRLLNENALREELPAPDFLKLCEAFRNRAAGILLERGACLDPTEASGVRAFFGLPLPSATAADDAVAAALFLDDAMRQEPKNAAASPLCGIGVATGKLTAGLVGQTYTVLGDAVELSRWLAAQTANYEVRLLTDAATHFAAERVEDRPLEFVNPPDGAAVEIFHLLGTTGSLSSDALARRQAFRDAIMLLRAGHAPDALQRFADAREGLTLPDPLLDYFVSLASDQSQRDSASSTGSNAPSVPAPASLTPSTGAAAQRRKGNAVRKLPRRP